MAATPGVTRMGSLLMGICLPSLKHNASKIRIPQVDFDTKLHAYFKKSVVLYAFDPQKICKTGDIVLIEKLKEQLTTSINHKVLQVVYHCGDITDPITGKKVMGKFYRDELEFHDEFFGKSKSRFDYENASLRGSQEDKRDFSHRELFKKYHEFEDGNENKNHPHETHY